MAAEMAAEGVFSPPPGKDHNDNHSNDNNHNHNHSNHNNNHSNDDNHNHNHSNDNHNGIPPPRPAGGWVGIDLGTSNCACAAWSAADGRARVLGLGRGGLGRPGNGGGGGWEEEEEEEGGGRTVVPSVAVLFGGRGIRGIRGI